MKDLKLATLIVTRNEEFSNAAWKKGHALDFDLMPKGPELKPEPKPEPKAEPEFKPRTSNFQFSITNNEFFPRYSPPSTSSPKSVTKSATSENGSSNRYMEDIEDLMHKSSQKAQSDQKIMPWLKSIYISSRGFEFGTFDPALISLIWKKQSVNWDDIALDYISNVIAIVHCFIRSLLKAICPNERILKELTSVLMEELVTRYQKAIDQVKFILRVERAGTPLTLNHYFNENLEKW